MIYDIKLMHARSHPPSDEQVTDLILQEAVNRTPSIGRLLHWYQNGLPAVRSACTIGDSSHLACACCAFANKQCQALARTPTAAGVSSPMQMLEELQQAHSGAQQELAEAARRFHALETRLVGSEGLAAQLEAEASAARAQGQLLAKKLEAAEADKNRQASRAPRARAHIGVRVLRG